MVGLAVVVAAHHAATARSRLGGDLRRHGDLGDRVRLGPARARWTKRKVTEAAQRALDPAVRRRNITPTVIGLVIIGVLVGIYLWKFGLVMPWKIKDQ